MEYIFILFTILLSLVNSLNQLSFSGGGSFGAVEIGILKRIQEIQPKNYDLYTGISAGALNAGVLSYYKNMDSAIENAEKLYSTIRSGMVYNIRPTSVSILNTEPLHKTITNIIQTMPNAPLTRTLIGATNIYSGKLDIYAFDEQNDIDKVSLLMSSCAIPGLFPPIFFKDKLYADGGTLSNELIDVAHDNTYLNITFITPYEDIEYDDSPITSIKDMLCRTANIILSNFNDPLASINENCKTPIGEINKYYVPTKALKKYNLLNFDKCAELIDIGYNNVLHKRYVIC